MYFTVHIFLLTEFPTVLLNVLSVCMLNISMFISIIWFSCPILFLPCNSVWIHPFLLPYRMLPLLSLEQKGSGPSLPPSLPPSGLLCALTNTSFRNSLPLLVCLTSSNLHNESPFEMHALLMQLFSMSVVKLKESTTFKVSSKLTRHTFTHSDSLLVEFMWRAGAWARSMLGMCVWGPQSQLPRSQGFSNDRLGFSKLAPVITHDPSVLRFPRCTHPRESWQPCVSFSVLFLHQIYPAWCPLWERNEPEDRGNHLTLLFSFPSPSLSFTPVSLILPLRHSWNHLSVFETNQL